MRWVFSDLPRIPETSIFWITLVFFVLASFSYALSGEKMISLILNGQTISAELEEVSLRLVLEQLRRERGIWFKGDESLLDKKLSVRFSNLPLEKGLRKILSDIDHVLVYDRDQRVAGLLIFAKDYPEKRTAHQAPLIEERPVSAQIENETAADRNEFERSLDASQKRFPLPHNHSVEESQADSGYPFADPFGL